MSWFAISTVFVLGLVLVVQGRFVPPAQEDQAQIQLEVGDFFKCAPLDEASVVCPDGSAICKCPPGFYGELTKDITTTKWSGTCKACPVGWWSRPGAKELNECVQVPCPHLASGHPNCTCDRGSVGKIDWLHCSGKYYGECIALTQGDLPPPMTTIFGGPHGEVNTASHTFFFKGSTESATYECSLDGVTSPCFAPSVTLENLAQGPHVFTVRSTDEIGQTETNPPSINFEINVPCPENSTSLGAPSYNCSCNTGFYSSTRASHPYLNGGYNGECIACEACTFGQSRVGCSQSGPGSCVNCPPNQYKELGLLVATWNTPCSDCETCAPGYSRVGCGDSSSGVCLPCRHGTFKEDRGSWDSVCMDCEPCPAGSQRVGCHMDSPGSCVPCPEHFHKADSETWNATCERCPGCEPGYERHNCTSTSVGVCLPCAVQFYKTLGVEDDYTAVCQACVPCSIGSGGYRAQCGGPFGPGTCEVCAECVGVPENQCFCDV